LLYCEALVDEVVDIFANATLAFEPVVHLSRRASDESGNVSFDFLNHAGEVACVDSVGLPGDT